MNAHNFRTTASNWTIIFFVVFVIRFRVISWTRFILIKCHQWDVKISVGVRVKQSKFIIFGTMRVKKEQHRQRLEANNANFSREIYYGSGRIRSGERRQKNTYDQILYFNCNFISKRKIMSHFVFIMYTTRAKQGRGASIKYKKWLPWLNPNPCILWYGSLH